VLKQQWASGCLSRCWVISQRACGPAVTWHEYTHVMSPLLPTQLSTQQCCPASPPPPWHCTVYTMLAQFTMVLPSLPLPAPPWHGHCGITQSTTALAGCDVAQSIVSSTTCRCRYVCTIFTDASCRNDVIKPHTFTCSAGQPWGPKWRDIYTHICNTWLTKVCLTSPEPSTISHNLLIL